MSISVSVSVDMRMELDMNIDICERKIVDICYRIALILGESDIRIDICRCCCRV
jgi:hypothetical protein